jgi:hypothetical protein
MRHRSIALHHFLHCSWCAASLPSNAAILYACFGALDALRLAGMFVPHHELGKQEVLEWLVSGFPASHCEVPSDIKPPSLLIVLTSRASSLWIVRPPIFRNVGIISRPPTLCSGTPCRWLLALSIPNPRPFAPRARYFGADLPPILGVA